MMPGLYAFGRRWVFGSDDFVISAIFLLTAHIVEIAILASVLGFETFNYGPVSIGCEVLLRICFIGFLSTLCVAVVLETAAAIVSMRGTIMDDKPRWSMEYIVYAHLGVQFVEVVWQVLGVVWLVRYIDTSCHSSFTKHTLLGVVVFQWILTTIGVFAIYFSYDEFGSSRHSLTGSGRSRESQLRRRSVRRNYERSWGRSLRRVFCCVDGESSKASFDEIARLFTIFFAEQNIVPSDIVAGFVLVRRHQRMTRRANIARQNSGGGDRSAYDIFSGVLITPRTQFLDDNAVPSSVGGVNDFATLIHYMRYAHAAYGWPMYMLANPLTGPCKLMSHMGCCRSGRGCCGRDSASTDSTVVIGDNCCRSNYVALRQLAAMDELDVVYVTYQTDISQPSFFIAVDYRHKSVVISIRGTLSLQDVLTDLMADADDIQFRGTNDTTWRAHKGILNAAEKTLAKIKAENLFDAAFERNTDRGTRSFKLVVVGHSLGAGTAAILAILLRQEPEFHERNVHCYSFSPPGGLLSEECVRDTKSFITTVILGKDIVSRLGLKQLNEFKQLMVDLVKQCPHQKWKVIGGGVVCCSQCRPVDEDDDDVRCENGVETSELVMDGVVDSRDIVGTCDSPIHRPLYLPGQIVHIVYKYLPPDPCRSRCGSKEQVIRAILADNLNDFNEVIISDKMVRDHRPEKVLAALEKIHSKIECHA